MTPLTATSVRPISASICRVQAGSRTASSFRKIAPKLLTHRTQRRLRDQNEHFAVPAENSQFDFSVDGEGVARRDDCEVEPRVDALQS